MAATLETPVANTQQLPKSGENAGSRASPKGGSSQGQMPTKPRELPDRDATVSMWLAELKRRAESYTKPAQFLQGQMLVSEMQGQLLIVELIERLSALKVV